MKRYCAFLLLFLVALSTLTPLLGAKTAQAQTQARNPETNSNIEMSDVFKDRENKTNGSDFWLGKQSATITGQGFKTTAKLQATLTLDTQFSPAEDDNKDGVFNKGDYLGGWNAILDDDRIGDLVLQNNNGDGSGIFLQLFEVGKGETLAGAGDGDVSKAIKQGGPYYSSDRLKIPFISTVGEFNRSIFVRGQGQFNIGPFFWFISSTQNFFGKRAVSTNIVLTDLKPDTKYYYRLILAEDWSSDESYTQITEQTSFTTDSTKADPSLEELQAISGTSNGSSVDGNASADIFGDRVECTTYPTTWFGCFAIGYYNTIYYISSWLLRAAAGLMDIFMAYSLSSFIYQNSFINTGWTVVRDVCNILFIFILLWTAFKMVINGHHHRAQEVIVQIIVVGLLINFSLFFSKAIIDMGNISARVFYNQIRITGSAQNTQDEVAQAIQTKDLEPKAISEALVNGLDITAIGSDGFKKLQTEAGGFIPLGTVWLLLLLGTAINITAAWIFVKVSFAFLGRIFSLWMGMIFSPFAFTSTIISGGHGLGHGPMDIKKVGWSDWLKNMLEAAFYPAVFLFFVFLIILLINDNFFAGMIGDTGTLSATAYLIVTIFKFIFIIGLIKVAGDFASKMSGMFGGEISAVAGKAAAFVGGAAIGLATGGAALGMQRLGGAGKAMKALSGTEGDLLKKASTGDTKAMLDLKNFDSKKYGHFGKVDMNDKNAVEAARKKAQREVESLQKRSTTSWDLRNTKGMQALSSATGLNMNAGVGMLGMGTDKTTGGLQAQVDRRAFKEAAYFKSIGASEDEIKRAKGELEEAQENLKEKEKADRKEIERLERENADYVQRKQSGDQNDYSGAVATNQRKIKEIKDRLDQAHADAKKENPDGTFADIPAPGASAAPEDKRKYDIAVAKRAEIEAEAKLKESSKGGLRRYQEYLQKNFHDGRDGNPRWGAFGVRRLIRGDIRGAMTDFRKDLSTALTGAMSGALVGAAAGPLGILAGAIGGGVLSSMNKHLFRFDQKLTDLSDHAIAANHIHEPHTKSKYKAPGGAWLEKVFSGKGFGGLSGGGGGHDDHGHDDHGGGGHH